MVAARLTDWQRKKVVADYVELGSYNAAAKLNGISATTVKNVVLKSEDFVRMCERKKEQNTRDMLAFMESRRDAVCEIIGLGLDALSDPKKFAKATPNQVTTAIGTLIDKWTAIGGGPSETAKEDALSKSLSELAAALKSDEDKI